MMRSKNYFCESRWIGNESLPHKSTLVSNISCCLDTEKKVNILEIIFPCWPLAEERKPILSARRLSLVKIFLSELRPSSPTWAHSSLLLSSILSPPSMTCPTSTLNWLRRSEDRKFSFVNKHHCRLGIKLSQCCSPVSPKPQQQV